MPQLKLGRKKAHRESLQRNLVASLIKHGKLVTTLPKAKLMRPQMDRILSAARQSTVASNQRLQAKLGGGLMVKQLLAVATKLHGRNFGHLRVVKLGKRLSDGSEMAQVEIITVSNGKVEDHEDTK